MKFKYDDIESAYFYVNSAAGYSNQAILCKDTGEIYYMSDSYDEDEIPENVDENEECVEIPDKIELNLGNNLVFEFMDKNWPEMYERVRQIFRSRGAYSKYKNLLDEKDLLQIWYNFENERESQVLREWCAENEIELDD